MKMLHALLLGATVSLAGCAAPRAPTASDAGPRPPDPRRVVQDFLRGQLKDPYSAQIEVRSLAPTQASGAMFGTPVYGWGICADANAKNAYGGYTGFKPVIVVWRADRGVLEGIGSFRDSALEDMAVAKVCRQLGG
ncbi:MAG: hypothetical protein KF788_16760 [Piscinibacter sp.]|nr:hypothetical protein [Piscinibacter sp.]